MSSCIAGHGQAFHNPIRNVVCAGIGDPGNRVAQVTILLMFLLDKLILFCDLDVPTIVISTGVFMLSRY